MSNKEQNPAIAQNDLLGEVSQEQIADWQKKAEKWDALGKKISEFYCNADDEYDEENPVRRGDLCDIGEEAAIAFGWL